MSFSEQLLVFIGVIVTTALVMKLRKKKEISTYRYPPSLPSLPFVGSVGILLMRDLTNVSVLFMKKAKELGPIFTFKIGSRLVVTLNSKEAIEKAYLKNGSTFSDRPEIFMDKLVNPENKGIAFMHKATDWKKPQQLSLMVLKEFGFGIKNTMETRILKEVEAMIEYARDTKGESFDPKDMCSLTTSNIILNILFGSRRDFHQGPSELTIRTHRMAIDLTIIYDIVPLVKFFPSYRKQMRSHIENCTALYDAIEAEIAESLQNTGEPCFVQSYIAKVGPDYDREQLNYLMRDLIAAGTDTSSTSLQWCLVALANHQEVQKRLYDEINAVVAGDRLPSLEDQAKLPYVEATILEINRWRTLIPLSVPRATLENSVIDGLFIPAGSMVLTNLSAVHNDQNLWKDPEVFRPERFLDSENNVVGKENVIAFSVGRRSCLGETLARAELFLILTGLVKRFLVLPPEGQDKVNEDPKMPVLGILFLTPFKIRLIERTHG